VDVFDLPFVQRGLWELLALALGAGLLGTWIVLRGLSFYAHAVGTAAFPGLVLADGLGFAGALGAFGAAAVVAAAVAWLARRDGQDAATPTAMVLVGALAGGVLLASDVFDSGARVDSMLFGSLLAVDGSDIALAAAASAAAVAGTLVLGPRWLAAGFDPATARAQGLRAGRADAVLLGLVALVAVASLEAIGALLTTALLVVPAATTRLVVRRLATWQAATVALVLAEGVAGLWLSVELNAPPGATIAVLAGGVFAAVAGGRVLLRPGGPRRAAAALAGLAALGAAGCGGGDGGDGGVRVVASTTHLADIARQVGGADARVTGLLTPSSDPHDYEPRPDDVRAVAEADVVLVSGLGLDEWVDELVESSGGQPRVVEVGPAVPHRAPDDPHWWQDPRNVAAAAQVVRGALAEAAPGAAARLQRRATAYAARVTRLDRTVLACMRRLPAAQRKLVTDHDAFGLLAARYDIDVVGTVVASRTTQAQPSAGDLARLARTIRAQGVRAIFPETQLEPRLARALARRTGVRVGGALYSDALGTPSSGGATVLAAAAHNARELVRGLSGGTRRCEVRGR